MIKPLSTTYYARYGVSAISHVDTAVFTTPYFASCNQCDFCKDECCSHGVAVGIDQIERIKEFADVLEDYVRIRREHWFQEELVTDESFPGGKYRRTQVRERGCVFLNANGRGCQLHRFSAEHGLDYHVLKPLDCCLFPLTYDRGLFRPASWISENTLICLADGPSLYEGAKHEIPFYFDHNLLNELNEMEENIKRFGLLSTEDFLDGMEGHR